MDHEYKFMSSWHYTTSQLPTGKKDGFTMYSKRMQHEWAQHKNITEMESIGIK